MEVIEELFQLLWADYTAMTPQAERVSALLQARGEALVNDHIALRTFAHDAVDIEVVDRVFVDAGYEPIDSYEFPDKKLIACHYEHPLADMPKVFISALLLDECSTQLREAVHRMLNELPVGIQSDARFVCSGRAWALDYSTYQRLLEESQYAAWLAAFGFRANHFTVAVHKLRTVTSLAELNGLLLGEGFVLNEVGGAIKGSPVVGLEQSSTMADAVEVPFADGSHPIPSCYYEFAYRHRLENGELYQGFVTESARHLFESTAG